jgi:hypothetical protein
MRYSKWVRLLLQKCVPVHGELQNWRECAVSEMLIRLPESDSGGLAGLRFSPHKKTVYEVTIYSAANRQR